MTLHYGKSNCWEYFLYDMIIHFNSVVIYSIAKFWELQYLIWFYVFRLSYLCIFVLVFFSLFVVHLYSVVRLHHKNFTDITTCAVKIEKPRKTLNLLTKGISVQWRSLQLSLLWPVIWWTNVLLIKAALVILCELGSENFCD